MFTIKYTRSQVSASIRHTAQRLKRGNIITDNTLFLVMLSGGVWFANHLFDALGDIPNDVQYIKGHSYDGEQRGQFTWDLKPENLAGRDVIVIDDICDSGATLKAIHEELNGQVKSIAAVTLMKRLPCSAEVGMPVYACIEDESKDFFVGCGLDCKGKGRLLREICIY